MRLVILALVLLLVGCGTSDENVQNTHLIGVNAVALTQSATFFADGGTITLNYPEGWTVDEAFGQISIINSGDVESLEVDSIREGLITGIITIAQSAGANLDDLAEQLSADTATSSERFTTNERDGLHLVAILGDTRRDTLIVSLNDETMVLVTVLGKAETLDTLRDTLRLIASSVQFEDIATAD